MSTTLKLPEESNFVKLTLMHEKALEELPLSNLTRTTDFILDKNDETGNYETRVVNYGTLSTMNVEFVRTADVVDLSGHWILSGNRNNSTMTLDLSQIEKSDKKYSQWWYNQSAYSGQDSHGKTAITYEFYKKDILKKIYDLSTEIYHRQHVPSYVGMIIHSSTLDSKEKVKKYYGGTDWKQLNGCFVCGNGKNNETNTCTKYGEQAGNWGPSGDAGGSARKIIMAVNLPAHNHAITFKKESFEFEFKGEITTTTPDSTWPGLIYSATKHSGQAKSGGVKPDLISVPAIKAKVTGSLDVSTVKTSKETLWGEELDLTPWIYSSSKECKNTKDFTIISNMPPYETKYIWIRTA